MNDVKFYLDAAEKKMQEAVDFLDDTLAHIRAGKANVKILDGIRVNYYGSPVPIDNVANVSTPDQRTIAIMPWERNMIGTIEKAIIDSNVGIMPINNGEVIRLNIPPLTEERRKEIVKTASAKVEQAKVAIRNVREDARKAIKAAEDLGEDVKKRAEKEIDDITKEFTDKVDAAFKAKSDEIMKI